MPIRITEIREVTNVVKMQIGGAVIDGHIAMSGPPGIGFAGMRKLA